MMPSIGEDFLEVRDCVFIKGFPSNSGIDVSDVREYFENKVGKCCVQMTALSKDKLWSFITLKFDSTGLAQDAIDRFHGKYIWGHKLQMSFWRVPENLAQSERFQRNHSLNSRRWDDKRSFEEETENSSRHSNDFSRETNTKPTSSRESVGYDGTEEFRVDQDNRRYHEGTFAERRKNFNYEEHCDEYSQHYWNTDEGEEEAYTKFDENWDGWNSDFSGRSENLPERAYYNREEELSHAHEGDIWPDRQEGYEGEQDFDQYDSYPEIFQDNIREECEDSHDGYNERPFEDAWEELPYRGEDLMPRNRQWYENQECTNASDCRNQERQWPRWEAVAPKSPSRRNPSDPDFITDTPRDGTWVENQRSCNERREFTGRRAAALPDERPRSDEWLRNTHKHFEDRGRHSASPVNVRPKAYGHREPPHLDRLLKASPEITSYSARSRRGRSSISPARNRHSSANRESSRSLSAERNSDFRHQGTLPRSERSSQVFNEQRLEGRKRESRSYSPNPNTKVPLLRERSIEDGNGNGGRRGTDLRRFLMLHQQRKHSSLRERSREKSTKHSERATKTSPDKRDKSPGYYSSAESSSSTQGTNRKRHKYGDEKRRDDYETTKRRRKTSLYHSDDASTYSDQENGNRDSTRKNREKTSESRVKREPPQEKKRKSGQQREHAIDYSIKKRADRLLNDVAVTLTECKIPLRRPERKEVASIEGKYKSSSITSVALKGGKSVGESSRLEHARPVATENLQSLDTLEIDRCTNETSVEGWDVEETPEENITAPDYNGSHLAVPFCEGSSDQDMSEVEEDYSSVNLSKENVDYVEKNAWTEEVSTENHDFVDVKKNWTFIADNSERTDRVEVHESDFQRSSKDDFMANVEEENSQQDNCTKDEPKSTNEPAETLVHNFDFALSQSPVTKNKICTENDTCNELISTNLQHIRKEISSAEETTPKLDLAREKSLPMDFGVYGESKTQLETSNSCLTKGRRGSDGNVYHKDLQKSVQRTSCNCQEETSPVVYLPNEVFCYPVELNNTENAVTERGEEDQFTERGSPDVTKADHKTSELSNNVLSFSPTRPDVPPPEIDVCRIVRNAEALKQGGYNTEESNCKNSGILAACTMEKLQVDATHTEQEQYISEREYRIHSLGVHFQKEVCKVECCESSPQYIDGDSEVKTKVISAMLSVNELEDDVSFFRCQEVTYTKEEVYILEGAKVTQREVYDKRDIDHVCNSKSEECQGKVADFDVTNTEQVCVAGINDTQQNLSNKVSVGEDIPDREDTNIEDVVVDATDVEKVHCAVESNVHGEENSNNVWNRKDEKHSSENAGFNTVNTEKVCDMESNDFTSGFNDAVQEKQRLNKVGVIKEERKHDEIDPKVYNMVDGCVTQQEVCCSNDGNRSDNTRKEKHTEISGEVNDTDTDQECYHVDTHSYNMADAQVNQETRRVTNNRTEEVRLTFSSQEVQLSEIASKGKPGDIGTCYSGWTGLEPCNSSATQAQYLTTDVDGTKSSASTFIISNVNSQVKEHHLVTDDFEHVDMEISSEEDPRDHSIGSSVCVNTSTSSIENDGCKLYSPSSPTWTSDEHRSPRPKDDTSPYSPSHPTNASEGDVEVCITREDVSCQGGKRGTNASICEEVCKNKSRSRGADEEEEVLHYNQIIKGDSMSDTTPRSSRYFRSPKSGAVLFQSVGLTKDFIDGNLPTKDLMKNRIATTSDENRNSVAKDSEVCSDSSTSDESDKQNTKPLLRSKKRAKSLPVTVSMDAKPKVVYVTAAKTYDFYTNRGTQHKPRILYATNDKSAGPVRSLSLDTALGKGWPLCENPNNRPLNYDQQSKFVVETISTVEVEKRKDGRDTDGHVEPMFPDGSFISDVPLKTTTFAAHVDDDDLEVVKFISTPKSASSEEGLNCTDSGVTSGESSVGKESLLSSCNAHQDTFPSRSLPKSDGLIVIQPPSALRQNYVPNEHCLSTDQIPTQLTGSETNWKRANVSNRSETPGTAVAEDRDFCFSDQKTSLPKSSVQPGSTVLEVEGENENENDAQSEYLREIQQLDLPARGNEQTLSNSTSCSANKRTHPDSTGEASRPYKVPRKPLKLIIPTTPLLNDDIKRTSQPAYREKYFKKTSTSTVTQASVNVVPESNSLKVLQGDVSAISEFSGDKETVMTERHTCSEYVGLACSLLPTVSGAPAITDCPTPTCEIRNTSPFTVDSPPCKTSNENNNIMEKKANNCSGKESEWIALRMERLKKKKEEIEQVYTRECHTVVNVVKMLVSNDPRLEGLLQNAVRRSLQDMGRRCVQELEKQVRPGS